MRQFFLSYPVILIIAQHLLSIQRISNDGTNGLPATTFTYGSDRGSAYYPDNGTGWNRIIKSDNGQGGVIEFNYDNVGRIVSSTGYAESFKNNFRVTSKKISSGIGQSYNTVGMWNYSYGTPLYNDIDYNRLLCRDLSHNFTTATRNPTSGILYLNACYTTDATHPDQLAHQPLTEFRGHNKTTVTAPDMTVTEHYFYQGDDPCGLTLRAFNSTLVDDPCFKKLRDGEWLKGKEYKTRVIGPTPGNILMAETLHTFFVDFSTYGGFLIEGLWQGWSYESQTDEKTYEGGATPMVKTTKYYYEPAYQDGGTQYGNLTRSEVYDSLGNRVTETRTRFATKVDSTNYIVNRPYQVSTFDGLPTASQNRLTMAWSFYDGSNVLGTLGTAGDVTRSRNMIASGPIPASLTGLVGIDATFSYDSFGNKTTATTYLTTGTSDCNTTTGVWTNTFPSGTGSRTSTVTYDSLFHSFSTQVQSPTVGSVTLTEQASYDYRMGTLSSITDANGNVTSATYDNFGRMLTLIKPGDTTANPSLSAYYYDSEIPYHYLYRLNEGPTTGLTRPIHLFYDGLGRMIQNKTRTVPSGNVGAQQVVTDTRYDPMGRVWKSSQPRYVNFSQGDTAYNFYTQPDTDINMRWTINSYDSLGRPYDITAPDTTKTSHRYGIGGSEWDSDVTLECDRCQPPSHPHQN